MARCGDCKFWKNIPAEDPSDEDDLGFCHRHPPAVLEPRESQNQTLPYVFRIYQRTWHPATSEEDWCGEFVQRVT